MNFLLVALGSFLLCVLAYTRLTHPVIANTLTSRIESRIEIFVLGISFGFMLKHLLLGTPSWSVGVIMILISAYCLYLYARVGIVPTWQPVKALYHRARFAVRRWRNSKKS